MLVGSQGNSNSKGKNASNSQGSNIPAAVSDTGCERELNEDRYAVIESPSGLSWIVCDGMGGVSGGELAAQLAIDAMRRNLEGLEERPADVALGSAIQEANRVIVLRRQNPVFAQMGTTVVAAMFQNNELIIGHAGDSRAYLIRDGAIQALTTDHTYVQSLVDKGHISPEEALSHPQAHILTRCLGAQPALDLSIQKFWIWEDSSVDNSDMLLLCSDGLYSLIKDEEMAEIASNNTPEQACMNLVELARQRGGYDNITLAIVPLDGRVQSEPPAKPVSRGRRSKIKPKRGTSTELEKTPINWVKLGIFVSLLTLLSFLATVSVVFLLAGK